MVLKKVTDHWRQLGTEEEIGDGPLATAQEGAGKVVLKTVKDYWRQLGTEEEIGDGPWATAQEGAGTR